VNYYPRAEFNVDDYEPYKEKSGFLYWSDGEEGHAYRHVPKNVSVLDIGYGHCETLGCHKARGCEVYGVEADENVKKLPTDMASTSKSVSSIRKNMNRHRSIT
jgi:hypothetical protein